MNCYIVVGSDVPDANMDEKLLAPLRETYLMKLRYTSLTFKRYLYSKINWNSRIVGIKGARGAGKTTLLMQRIKDEFGHCPEKAFYASLDDMTFRSVSLQELVRHLYSEGVRNFFLDEVHRYPEWSLVFKNLYDSYPDIKIAYTGSSMIIIDNSKADLSRRQSLYTLECMSFREFLEFDKGIRLDPVALDEILSEHTLLASRIASNVDVLTDFNSYIKRGCYPFEREAGPDYLTRLRETVNLVVESDFPAVEDVEYETVQKIKKMLMISAGRVPFVPNMTSLCGEVGMSRELGLRMLYALDRAGILRLLTEKIKSYKHLSKPEKIYLNDTNMMYALTGGGEVGTRRETFFFNQMSAVATVTSFKKGDFKVQDKFLFEIGGKDKDFSQIADMADSYVAADDITIGSGNKIPIWLFGLMY